MDANPISERKLALTYREAAQALGVSERKVWELVDKGQLKAVRIGRSVRIRRTDLEAFLAELLASN
jgi:excisionase family DNA binding protein